MSNITVGQLILDAQRMASRVKDLDALGSALLIEAEGNNRLVESLRQFQDDIDSMNRVHYNKSNAEVINRIQQQNANSTEILKENRELKVCVEDYERAMELIMQKYREHTGSKVLESHTNFKDVYNEKLWNIIREQREKINEMAVVMQHAASIDDEALNRELEVMSRLRLENKTLRELLQISKQFGSANQPIKLNDHNLVEIGVQTETDDSADELSLSGASIDNANNDSVVQLCVPNADVTNAATPPKATTIISIAATTATDNEQLHPLNGGINNNGPNDSVITTNIKSPTQMVNALKVEAGDSVSLKNPSAETLTTNHVTSTNKNADAVDTEVDAAAAATISTSITNINSSAVDSIVLSASTT